MPNPDLEQIHSDQPSGPTLRCITINLNAFMLAIPIDRIERVIKQTQVLGSGLNHVGLAHYEGVPITVVDLHHKLFHTPQVINPQEGYLIIANTTSQNKFAFPIQKFPNLIEFSTGELRVLPSSYRSADTLSIASHVVRVVQSSGENITFFILDMDYLANQYNKDKFQPVFDAAGNPQVPATYR
ncbi:MAG: chemotaxis protein CheW [Cyanobacteria bacterium P01_F01_bin.86]